MKKVSLLQSALLFSLFLIFSIQAKAQNSELSSCASYNIVAESCVGACGNPGELSYTVPIPCSSLSVPLCLSNISSNLCPSHRAIARILVNGQFVAQGDITAVGSNISFSAPCGANVKVVVYAFDVVPGVVCVQLGDLKFALSK